VGRSRPNAKGETHPRLVHIVNPRFTFDGREYMRQHSSVCYELQEREELRRMYEELSRLSPGRTATIGELQIPLVHFGEMFKENKTIQENFHRFAGSNRKLIKALASRFADHQIPIEDLVILKRADS
jgi:hypothetical protein